MKFDREAAEADPLIAIAGGGGVNLFNSQGNPWTADYLKITGELDVDLRSNIAAEARAKIVYERLINFCDDAGTKDALQFLMTREITHMKAFAAALESMKKPAFSIGEIAPTPGLVNQFFNDSTGTGDEGEIDTRGPWNRGRRLGIRRTPRRSSRARETRSVSDPDGEFAADRAGRYRRPAGRRVAGHSPCRKAVDQGIAQDGEGRPLRSAARTVRTAPAGDRSADRASQRMSFAARRNARTKPCKGMMGLVEEGQEVMKEGQEKEDAVADLALIGAAQRVEHYEISAYTTAKNLAQQLRHSAIVALLSKSLAEEENADQLLNQIARSLMSVAKMPAAIEQAEEV